MIPALKNLPYKDRLKMCNMSTLHYRRVGGDMIETYEILSGKYDNGLSFMQGLTFKPSLLTKFVSITVETLPESTKQCKGMFLIFITM